MSSPHIASCPDCAEGIAHGDGVSNVAFVRGPSICPIPDIDEAAGAKVSFSVSARNGGHVTGRVVRYSKDKSGCSIRSVYGDKDTMHMLPDGGFVHADPETAHAAVSGDACIPPKTSGFTQEDTETINALEAISKISDADLAKPATGSKFMAAGFVSVASGEASLGYQAKSENLKNLLEKLPETTSDLGKLENDSKRDVAGAFGVKEDEIQTHGGPKLSELEHFVTSSNVKKLAKRAIAEHKNMKRDAEKKFFYGIQVLGPDDQDGSTITWKVTPHALVDVGEPEGEPEEEKAEAAAETKSEKKGKKKKGNKEKKGKKKGKPTEKAAAETHMDSSSSSSSSDEDDGIN